MADDEDPPANIPTELSETDIGEDGTIQTLAEEGEPEKLTDEAEDLAKELAKITVSAPTTAEMPVPKFNPDDYPETYQENSAKEKLVLQYAENFRRQYVHLYRDRKPLFLNPLNEFGVDKFVCTSIRPTELPFIGLYDWDGAAEFVADYLNFQPLDPPCDLPKAMLSSPTVLKQQKGNCFEYSTLLCSLLIGAGYDAYVVSGYATKETCLMDETREVCPLLRKIEVTRQEAQKREIKKYTVKPPKDLRSKFILKMERRKAAAEAAEDEKQRLEHEAKIAEMEKPPTDPLFGLRIHAWVMVLAGKREVPDTFFIEPFTGLSHSCHSDNYLGIESLWNHQNYWVNMQDCSKGVKLLKYDLGDCGQWEFMFPSNDKPLLQMPDIEDDLDDLDEEEQEEVERHLDMPPPWIDHIRVSPKEYELRCPLGKKTMYYKKAKLEKFAHYLTQDGLVSRLSQFNDYELYDLVMVKEYFRHRVDKLHTRVHNHQTGWKSELFHPGRYRCLKEHVYRASAPGPENDRTMVFYDEARVDGLVKREETPVEMTEHFKNREDFLYYRNVIYGKRPKRFGPAEGGTSQRPILKITERFHRNKNKLANEDVSERIFWISDEKIILTYHTEDSRISASTREYIKPHNADEKGAVLQMTADMHTTFQIDPNLPSKKNVELYEILIELINAEDQTKQRVRESEEEVREMLTDRANEEAVSDLEISVYDTERNEKAKKHRKELERQLQEEKMRRQEMELDYLAPFLAQMGDPEKINRQQAYKLKEECLHDLKQRLIDKANLIQARFEKETQELQKKQQWYQQNQMSMQKDDEEEYLNYCAEAMFKIHILELRLNRHKEMAPHKYVELDSKLKSDVRLAEHFM